MTLLPGRLVFAVLLALAGAQAQSPSETDKTVRALYERGAWTEAAQLAAEANSRSADLDLYLGLSLARLGKIDAAGQVFQRGQRAYPADPRFALELAGVAYRQHNAGRAKKLLQRALRLDKANRYGNDFLATLFLIEGNLPAALKYWNRVDKPLIQNLHFDPLPPLRPLLRERLFTISGGQVFTVDRLRTTEANLDRITALASYRFDLTPRPDQRFDLTFRSLERGRLASGWVGKVLPWIRGLPYQAVFLDRDNLRERAISLSALGRWDADKRRIQVSLGGPVRLDPRWKFRFGVDARDERWDLRSTYFGSPDGLPDLGLRKVEAGGDLEFGLTGKLQWTSGLWVAWRDFQNADQASFFSKSWSFQLRNGLNYRLWSVPERRLRVEGAALLRTGRVLTGSSSRVIGVEGNLNAVWLPQPKGDDLAVNLRAGAAKTFGAVPFDEWFMLGMERDTDLWMRGHLGARDGRKGTAPLGTWYSIFQTSLDRTIFRFSFVRIQMGPFFDLGRAGDPSGRFGSRGWIQDTGLQAKVRILGNLTWTFVYGRNLRDGRGAFYTTISR